MKNQDIQLIPADLSLAKQATDYYTRNRSFLEAFEPVRDEEFFSLQYQQEVLKREMLEYEEKTAFRFYITPVERPTKIIRYHWVKQCGMGGLLFRFSGI